MVFLSFGRVPARIEAHHLRQHDPDLRLLRISSEHERPERIEQVSAVGTMIGEIRRKDFGSLCAIGRGRLHAG